ncbi:unnamed protein product, partial [Scytosiphon promiscuus]
MAPPAVACSPAGEVGANAAAATSSGAISEPSPQSPPSNAAVDEAWKTLISIVDTFPASLDPLQQKQKTPPGGANDREGSNKALIAANLSVLRAGGLLEVLQAYVLSVLDKKVRDEVAPRFWALLDPAPVDVKSSSSGRDGQEGIENGEKGAATAAVEVAVAGEDDSAAGMEAVAATRRDSYRRVKSALLYVAGEVTSHLSLVRLLDDADNSSGGGGRNNNTFSSTHPVQARYRCAFTAQVMAGARGDFHGTMRAFFDRNLRFWHRSWLEERRRRRRRRRRRYSSEGQGGGEGQGDDGMDV